MNFVKFSLGLREENNSVLWGAEERSLLSSVLQKYVFVVFFCLFVFVWIVLPPESKKKHCSQSLLVSKKFEDLKGCLPYWCQNEDISTETFISPMCQNQYTQEAATSKCWWISRLFDSKLIAYINNADIAKMYMLTIHFLIECSICTFWGLKFGFRF